MEEGGGRPELSLIIRVEKALWNSDTIPNESIVYSNELKATTGVCKAHDLQT